MIVYLPAVSTHEILYPPWILWHNRNCLFLRFRTGFPNKHEWPDFNQRAFSLVLIKYTRSSFEHAFNLVWLLRQKQNGIRGTFSYTVEPRSFRTWIFWIPRYFELMFISLGFVSRLSKYPPLATDTEVNNCSSRLAIHLPFGG